MAGTSYKPACRHNFSTDFYCIVSRITQMSARILYNSGAHQWTCIDTLCASLINAQRRFEFSVRLITAPQRPFESVAFSFIYTLSILIRLHPLSPFIHLPTFLENFYSSLFLRASLLPIHIIHTLPNLLTGGVLIKWGGRKSFLKYPW